jgi:hypothetical protein
MEKYLIRFELVINRKFIGCFGMIADEKQKIIDAAPMGKKSIGKKWKDVASFYSQKRYNGTDIHVIELDK